MPKEGRELAFQFCKSKQEEKELFSEVSDFGGKNYAPFADEWPALLIFEKAQGTLAQAQGALETWSFKRCGIWAPYVSVRKVGQDRDLGHFYPGENGGLLFFSKEHQYDYVSLMEAQQTSYISKNGEIILELLAGYSEGQGLVSQLRIRKPLKSSELFLLASFMWYLHLLIQRDQQNQSFLQLRGFPIKPLR